MTPPIWFAEPGERVPTRPCPKCDREDWLQADGWWLLVSVLHHGRGSVPTLAWTVGAARGRCRGEQAHRIEAAAITMGIATKKSLLLFGDPTQIVAGIHGHRLELPALLSKLQSIGRRMGISPRI